MDTPENYYNILGVPIDADNDTLKRAYRQLARRYHPDLTGSGNAVEMKRINRAYDVLSDPIKRQNYDTIIGGVIDLRKHGYIRPRPHISDKDFEFSGLNIFGTRGPYRAGPVIHSTLGVISALSSIHTVQGILIAAGSLNGKGTLWSIVDGHIDTVRHFETNPGLTIESLRELRLSEAGSLLAGWGRLHLHVWDTFTGALLLSYPLLERAVSAHYSLDMNLQITPDRKQLAHIALPHLPEDGHGPRSLGVRGTDVVIHELGRTPIANFTNPLVCIEQGVNNRQFWAIRLRALSQDMRTLITLSCAQIPQESQQMVIVRRWNLGAQERKGRKAQPQITTSIIVERCEDCTPPYTITRDASMLAYVHQGNKILLCDTTTGTYSEVASGTMGGSSKLALSPDGQWLAVAREDSEVNEGVVDLWSIKTGQVMQKFYHPWQISALHFTEKQLLTALTDGTIQIWE